jgi:CopG-like RHH_1 or ribbon-helix-helix domain, RHH_5
MTISSRENRLVPEPSRAVATRLNWDAFDAVEQLAAEQGVSRSRMVQLIVERYVAQLAKKASNCS